MWGAWKSSSHKSLQCLFSELVVSGNGIQLNSVSPRPFHLWPILATISLFSQTKPLWWPTWRRSCGWFHTADVIFIHAGFSGAPGPASFQDHCELNTDLSPHVALEGREIKEDGHRADSSWAEFALEIQTWTKGLVTWEVQEAEGGKLVGGICTDLGTRLL